MANSENLVNSYKENYFHRFEDVIDGNTGLWKNLMFGTDGTTRRSVTVDASGNLKVVIDSSDVNLPVTKEEKYIMKVDEASATITYVGTAVPTTLTSAASWQVKRIDTGTIAADILFADGNTNFDNIWDNRASLSYS